MSCCSSITINPCSISINDALTLLNNACCSCGTFCDANGGGSISTPMPPSPLPQYATFIQVEENNVSKGTFNILNFWATGVSTLTVTNAGNGQADIIIDTDLAEKILRNDAISLASTDDLIPGKLYWIVDVADGEGTTNIANAFAGIILRAVDTNIFDPIGVFISRNINRTAVPTLWAYNTAYVNGNLVENFNEVYVAKVASTNITLNPAANTTDWDFVPKSDNTKYVTEIQRCVYDITRDLILQRSDARGNVMSCYGSAVDSNNSIILKCFRWGYTSFFNNKINIALQSIPSTLTNRMPNQQNFKLNAISGTISNNNIDLISVANSFVGDVPQVFARTVTNVFITNNTLENSRIWFSDNMRMITNDLSESRVEGNVYVLSSGVSHISNNKGSLEILNNTSNTGNVNNDPAAPIRDTEVINCTGQPMIPSGSTSNRIENNAGCLIYNCNFKQAAMVGNVNLFVYGCNLEIGAFISNNITDGRDDNDRFISQISLRSEAGIYRNTFLGLTSLVGGYVQKIIYGTITNRYSYIANVLFSPTVNRNITLDGTAYTLKTALISGFTLDNVHIDGNYTTGAVIPANYTSGVYSIEGSGSPAYLPKQINDAYSGVNLTNAANNSYAFLNMEDNTIFAAGVLTIPSSCLHAKTFVLYGIPNVGYTVTKVVINTGFSGSGFPSIKSSYVGPWRFINGTGLAGSAAGVTFSLTSVTAPIVSDQIVRSTSLSSVTLLRSSEFIEITRNDIYYTLSNVQQVA